MFPLRDDIQPSKLPVVNHILITICVLTYLLQMTSSSGLVDEFGMIPFRIGHPTEEILVERETIVQTQWGPDRAIVSEPLPSPKFHPITTLLSCIFLHGSFMHLFGNMWFLYVFGDNVEDRLGPSCYLFFYLGSGVAASFTHYAFQPSSLVPTIGASGAVAGVMGAYMWLYPQAKVLTMIPIFFILQTFVMPAPIFLGIWFAIQLVQGTYAMGDVEAAGVAWWAHAGGFLFGLAFASIVGRPAETVPRVRVLDPDGDIL